MQGLHKVKIKKHYRFIEEVLDPEWGQISGAATLTLRFL